jgi:tetratricopeptide (TPR) repeat protein
MGRLDEAEDSYRRALLIMPESSITHYNLGITLGDMSRLHEAEDSYRRALNIKPDLAEALFSLGQTLYYLDDLSHSIEVFQKTFECDPFNRGLDAAIYLATLYYLNGDIEQCQNHLLASKPILEKASIKDKSTRIYWRYLDKLRARHQQLDRKDYQKQGKRTLYVVGESHSLAAHEVVVRYREQEMRCSAEWIQGCKQWHLGNDKPNKYKHKFEAVMARLPLRSTILLTIGEIDCRHNEGIIKVWEKQQNKTLAEIVQSTEELYINYVAGIGKRYGHRIIIGGVPASNISLDTLTAAYAAQFVNLISLFNSTLMEFAVAAGIDFLDVYSLTDRGDGIATGQWHIDDCHLLPCAVTEAFAKHLHSIAND